MTPLSWCKLTDHGVLRFEGTDARAFLQGQLTNDIAAIDATRSQYSGYCTPKGRLLAVMLLWQQGSAYYMLLPRELCEPLRKRLSMYILRSKVTVKNLSDSCALFGVSGDRAADVVSGLVGAAPTTVHGVTHTGTMAILKLPVQRYLIAAEAAHSNEMETTLVHRTAASPASLWTLLDIEAGIPNVLATTQEIFVLQALNFDLIHAVSFDKGCYPGQEIVARTRYLGKVKQRMAQARIATAQAPAPGDPLYSATFGEQVCGHIVSAVQLEAGHSEVLAVVHVSDIGNAAVHWRTVDGPVLQFAHQPDPAT